VSGYTSTLRSQGTNGQVEGGGYGTWVRLHWYTLSKRGVDWPGSDSDNSENQVPFPVPSPVPSKVPSRLSERETTCVMIS
jgi:hypothetical protein